MAIEYLAAVSFATLGLADLRTEFSFAFLKMESSLVSKMTFENLPKHILDTLLVYQPGYRSCSPGFRLARTYDLSP